MTSRFFVISVIAGLFVATVGCETSSRKDETTGDVISVTAVNIDSGSNAVNVSVDYSLASVAYGELEVGFNNGDDPTWYTLITNVSEVVAAGSSNFVFHVGIGPSNWVNQIQPSVYVSLSVALHSIPWTPLADDTEEFNFPQ